MLTALGRTGPPMRRAAAFSVSPPRWPGRMKATFLKAATDTLAEFGIPGMLIRWPVYALIGAAIAGTLLEQAALHVGPLSVSQPLLVIINPFASIILSVWLFDERFTNSPARIAIAALSFAVMAAGVIMLTRTSPQDLRPSEPARSSPSQPLGSGDS